MEDMKNSEKVLNDKGLELIKEMAKTKVEISNLIAECKTQTSKK